MIGLTWVVTIRANASIKIGCQDHPREFWESATDEQIAEMEERALEFWCKYREVILDFPVPGAST